MERPVKLIITNWEKQQPNCRNTGTGNSKGHYKFCKHPKNNKRNRWERQNWCLLSLINPVTLEGSALVDWKGEDPLPEFCEILPAHHITQALWMLSHLLLDPTRLGEKIDFPGFLQLDTSQEKMLFNCCSKCTLSWF